MDQGTLVERRIADGQRIVDQLAADGRSVRAAFWAKTSDEDLWYLYVVSEDVDTQGAAAEYRAVYDTLKKLGGCSVSFSEVKVLGPSNPIARAVISLASSVDLGALGHFGIGNVGGLEEGWVYRTQPPSLAKSSQMTAEEVGRRILRLMNRGPGILEPSQVTLKDGTTFSGVPFSLEVGSDRAMAVQFVVDHEPTPRATRLDDIASIH